MSRIYEALQRAETERNNNAGEDNSPMFDALASPSLCTPLAVEDAVEFENLAQYPWTPSVVELPALADRGKYVEQFRSLRSNLHLQRLQRDLKSILVTSGYPGEGKSFIAANLVVTLAHNAQGNVLLIDADLRRPTMHKLLGTSSVPGLADYLEGSARLSEIIQSSATPKCADMHVRGYSNVAFIPAGTCSDNTLELVCSHRMDQLLAKVSRHFDWIVLDSPPAMAVNDAVDLARVVDAVLLVARAQSTPYATTQKLLQIFSGSRLLGFVLNGTRNAPRQDRHYSYYYDSEPGAHAKSGRKHTRESRK